MEIDPNPAPPPPPILRKSSSFQWLEDLQEVIYGQSQHQIDDIDDQLLEKLQTVEECLPYSTDVHPFPRGTDIHTLLMAFHLETYRATYHPDLHSKELWDRLHNLPQVMDMRQDKPYILSLGQRIRKAADQLQIKELYVQIP